MNRTTLEIFAAALVAALFFAGGARPLQCRTVTRSGSEAQQMDLGNTLTRMEEKRRILNQLDELDQALAGITAQMDALSSSLQRLQARRSEVEEGLRATEDQLQKARAKARARLVALYKFKVMSYALPLTTVHDLHTAIQAVTAMEKLLEADRETFRTLRSRRLEMMTTRAALDEYQFQQEELTRELKRQARKLRTARDEKIRLLIALNRTTPSEFGESDRSRGGFRTAPDTPPQDLAASQGRLPLPVPGKVIRAQNRKKYSHYSDVLYNNGILIEARSGQPVLAVHRGRVVFADRFSGYGKIMIIEHGGSYYTLTAHLGRLLKKPGDPVEAGEVVATVGPAPSAEDANVYFEIRFHDQPVDPSKWLDLKQ